MKVDSVYPTLLLGVSQQAPQARLPGQHAEQVNMMPDPVSGLARRPGSLVQAVASGAPEGGNVDLSTMRQYEFSYANKDYVVCAPTLPYADFGQPLLVYNITDRRFMSVVYNPGDAGVQTLMDGGLSAITSIGKYVFAAGHDTRMAATTTELWGESGVGNFGRAAVWVRAGAFSRTIKVTVTEADDNIEVLEYTTPSSSYGELLDTSAVPVFAADPAGGTQVDTEAAYVVPYTGGGSGGRHELNWYEWTPTSLSVIRAGATLTNVHPAAPTTSGQYAWDSANPRYVYFNFNSPAIPLTVQYTHAKVVANPNYTKIVSDLTNAYNSAVTAWIVSSAEAIQAGSIAEELRLLAVAAGLTVTRQEGHVFFSGVKNVVVDDGGDGSLVLATANTVQDVTDLTKKHYVGKVVRIKPQSSAESFYMKAEAADAGVTGYADVVWIEGAATQYSLADGLIYGTPSGDSFYVASSATALAALLPGDHPDYTLSRVGDKDTSPLPYFVNRKISYLGVFQDRLLVGSDAVIRASKVGEYLNFFRTSVLTVTQDDALEMLSQGTNDDEIKFGVLYDKSLVLFGKRQYVVSGTQALTPTSAIMPVLSSHSGANATPPLAAGGVIFYCKQNEDGTSVHQLQPSRNSDQAEAFPVSSQLRTYIPPSAQTLIDVATPSMLMVRTKTPRDIYVYQYLDSPEGRQQAAWYRWEYALGLGVLLALVPRPEGILLLWHRDDKWVADMQPLSPGLSPLPYLDSQAGYDSALATGDTVAYDMLGPYGYGGTADDAAELIELHGDTGLHKGFQFPAYVEPSPVYARDNRDKARLTGELVVTTVGVQMKESAGFNATLTDLDEGTVTVYEHSAEAVGLSDPDSVALATRREVVGIGQQNEHYVLRIAARDWLPLTITAIDWTGQYYNRTQRIN